MEETFTLPVSYKGKEYDLAFTFRRLGYTYKISTQLNGQELLFEPDEEGSFRATLANPNAGNPVEGSQPIDKSFVAAIIEVLTVAFK